MTAQTKSHQPLTSPLDIAGEFPDQGFERWRATAEKSLKGKPLDRLATPTLEGLDVDPLYCSTATAPEAGSPGLPPFTRGASVLGNRDFVPGCLVSHPDPAEAAKAIASGLDLGMGSFWVQCCDLRADSRHGVVLADRKDVDTLISAVEPESKLHLDASSLGFATAAAFIAALDKRGLDDCLLSFGLDPLSTLAEDGKLEYGLAAAYDQMAAASAWSAEHRPTAIPISISSLAYHRAGASAVEELAFAASTAVAYLRALAERGLGADDMPRLRLVVPIGRDAFMEIARLRATRRVLGHILESCGLPTDRRSVEIHAITSPRTMSQRDPWVNLLRVTVESFAAAAGGADTITTLPFDAAIGQPSDQSRRLAANTLTILRDESHLCHVADPGGGSHYVEDMTRRLAESSWHLFQRIEGDGGMAAWLRSGSAHETVAETCYNRFQDIAKRKAPITGVSSYANLTEDRVERPPVDGGPLLAEATKRGPDSGTRVRHLAQTLGGHAHTADAFAAATAAFAENARIAEFASALRSNAGIPMTVTPFNPVREAAPFEELRDRSEAFLDETGNRPRVFLANLGSLPEHKARAAFATNFLEAGGIAVIGNDGFTDAEQVAQAFAASGAEAAVICSTDDRYAEMAAGVAEALVHKGAVRVLLAGKPGDHEQRFRQAGIDTFIHLGSDVLGTLIRLLGDLGVHHG